LAFLVGREAKVPIGEKIDGFHNCSRAEVAFVNRILYRWDIKKSMETECESTSPQLRSWVEVNLEALRENARTAKRLVEPAGLLPVVKANAYGHGAVQTVRALRGVADVFAVANLREALELRAAGIQESLVLLSPCLASERKAAVEANCLPTVSSAEEALAYAQSGCAAPVSVHFKLDSGMGRLGAWKEEGIRQLLALSDHSQVRADMISTHLSSADADELYTLAQLDWFRGAVHTLRPIFPGARFHVLNSAGILRHPEFAFDLVRPGLMLYGVSPVPEANDLLRPVMSWRARVTLVRDFPPGHRISYGGDFVTTRATRLAVLSVGYADGYFRQIPSGKGRVLVGGKSCPVVGRVTMDQIMVDLTGVESVAEGSVATLLGEDGGKKITASEMAEWAGTISWHVLTAIQPRGRDRNLGCA